METFRIQAKAAEKTEAELQALKAAGQVAADALKFDEATTRKRLIDKQLVSAGWEVDPNGGNTSEVTLEEAVPQQPTASGIGYGGRPGPDGGNHPADAPADPRRYLGCRLLQIQGQRYYRTVRRRPGTRPLSHRTGIGNAPGHDQSAG